MHYFLYLDEFGHIGPYVSATDPRYKTSPIFGLGGMILPASSVRNFSTFFFQLKNRLCRYELQASGVPPYQWEYKGSSVYRPKNIKRYPELRCSTNRMLNTIQKSGGHIFYVGLAKYLSPQESNPEKLYLSVLKEVIKRVEAFAERRESTVSIVLDQVSSIGQINDLRAAVVSQACIEMFGANHRIRLIEPPMQVESHLYQTVQCADWLCALIARVETFQLDPESFHAYEAFDQYFGARVKEASIQSGVRRTIPSDKRISNKHD